MSCRLLLPYPHDSNHGSQILATGLCHLQNINTFFVILETKSHVLPLNFLCQTIAKLVGHFEVIFILLGPFDPFSSTIKPKLQHAHNEVDWVSDTCFCLPFLSLFHLSIWTTVRKALCFIQSLESGTHWGFMRFLELQELGLKNFIL